MGLTLSKIEIWPNFILLTGYETIFAKETNNREKYVQGKLLECLL